MAQPDKKPQKKTRKIETGNSLPFTKKNYQIFGIGLVVILIGYIFMMQGPVDSFMSLTLSPIILVIGYLGIIPYSILYRDKSTTK